MIELKKQLQNLQQENSPNNLESDEVYDQRIELERLELFEQQQKLKEENDVLRDILSKFNDEENIAVRETERVLSNPEHIKSDQYIAAINEWFEDLIQVKLSKEKINEDLKDGRILCQVMNKIRPGSIKKIQS